ncbi:MAG TPA: TetR/AcrR family transcriptional regulator [Sphingopyxis sp.]|jgi:AcrR family transcriptional regulator|uniref:TetR/AcrR family transcriptional regulator n=1 Tax=Sphingopyxis sp. TaxID=1908224 RepID=UPI002E374E10|nr:TetR/AcrR family transcriptional regulator [Sphingopyxis sp.]HEX2813673.1 TetR/AcrR family transcriptional regulator [Sphingopyxis sp.]
MTLVTEKDFDRRQRRTRAALHGALDRLIDRLPFSKLSISQISDEADVGRPTFYRHFADVNALLIDRLRGDLEEQAALARSLKATNAPSRTLLTEVTAFACRRIATHPALYRALLDGSAGANGVALFREQIAHIVGLLQTQSGTRNPHRSTLVVGAVAGAVAGFLLAWIEDGLDPDIDEAATLLVNMTEPLMVA